MSYGFSAAILGDALVERLCDVLRLEWTLVHTEHAEGLQEYVRAIEAAADILEERRGESGSDTLSLEEKVWRLELAFAGANGARRLKGGHEARTLLEQLQRKLGVLQVPSEPFPRKGYILYQDAYLMRLNNAGQMALDRFEESATADEVLVGLGGPQIHLAYAVMSRIAAANYRIDLAVFSGSTPDALEPDHGALNAICGDLLRHREVLEKLLSSPMAEEERLRVGAFRISVLAELVEVAGWLGDSSAVEQYLNAPRAKADTDEVFETFTRAHTRLAQGALALARGQYHQAVQELEGLNEVFAHGIPGAVPGMHMGKADVMLAVAYKNCGRLQDAEKVVHQLLSDEYPVDAGNGLARDWAWAAANLG